MTLPAQAPSLATPERRAIGLARGLGRFFALRGFSSVAELVLPTGRRVDVAAIDGAGGFVFVEIKTSLADFRADQKWESYREFCDQLFFAVPMDFPREILPEDAGLILADEFGGEILRDAPLYPLPGARRKSMLLRFAHHAAGRLQRVVDPGFEVG